LPHTTIIQATAIRPLIMSLTSDKQKVIHWIAQRSGRIFGFRITPTTQSDLIDATILSIDNDQPLIIASQNLHGLYLAATNDAFRTLHELPQSLVHIDGFPLIYLAWLHNLRQTRMRHRTAVHDWLPHYARVASANRWRLYCLGSHPDVNARAIEALTRIAHFDATKGSSENRAVLNDIIEFNPDIVIVGMGMGRQEQWILDNLSELGNRRMITVGACLEYMAGEMPICPRWFGPFGLEMVWRLVTRPQRYAHRYLVEPWLLLGLLIKSGRLFGKNS